MFYSFYISIFLSSLPAVHPFFLPPLQLIVAVTNDEVPRLEDLYQRGIMNGVKGLTFLSRKELKEVEPHCEVNFKSRCFFNL